MAAGGSPLFASVGGALLIGRVLEEAGTRPERSDTSSVKNRYAVRFADSIATLIAGDLAGRFPGIAASTKRTAGSALTKKQLDINFSTPELGLVLGISLKSVHTRDVAGAGRYTHNMKRNEEELRIEAYGYHKRQPYAVMIGVLFLPADSCDDGKKENPSSFGSWVRHLRPYTGRVEPTGSPDLFEKIYVGLYEPDGSELAFFDVQEAPPKQGRPARLLSYNEFLDAVYHTHLRRNHAEFQWSDGEEEPLAGEEEETSEAGADA
jgi:hypothetical protein